MPHLCCRTCGGAILPRNPGGLDAVAERFLAEEDTPIDHMPDLAFKGDNVLLLDHGQREKVKGCPTYKRRISQGHFHIIITVHHQINAADKLYRHLPATTKYQVLFVATRDPPVVNKDKSPVQLIEAAMTVSSHTNNPRPRRRYDAPSDRKSMPHVKIKGMRHGEGGLLDRWTTAFRSLTTSR